MSQQFPARPAVAPLQSSSAYISSYSSSSSLASPSPQSAAPLSSPTMSSAPQQYAFGSLNQSQHPQQQSQSQQNRHQQPQQQHPMQLQRHPSYEYQPNRQGAGATQSETAAYLNSAALLAEAAKRASIQVVMRDIEEMEL